MLVFYHVSLHRILINCICARHRARNYIHHRSTFCLSEHLWSGVVGDVTLCTVHILIDLGNMLRPMLNPFHSLTHSRLNFIIHYVTTILIASLLII